MKSTEGLRALLDEHGIPSTSRSALRLHQYLQLLAKWNRKVNLTSSTDWSALYPHFAEAIWASRFYPPQPRFHLDIGSGAGFPALLLKIVVPEMILTLVESRSRRASFLETVIGEAGLENVAVISERIEDVLDSSMVAADWDMVSWKAIRLGRNQVERLIRRVAPVCEFWLFHGATLPLRNCRIDDFLMLVRRETAPFDHQRHLSIYRRAI